jgi:DHA2 family multidrug resistance protein-like MFS transporter
VNTLIGSRAGRRQWIGLAVIALPCILVSMDLDVLYLAVPSLSRDLAPSSSQLLWITDIYGFLVAGWLITMGGIGDRIGRRRLLLIGACAFGVASVLAAFSTSANMLIAARALLGVAGATLAPSTLSLIRNMFLDPRQRTLAIGVWAASFSVGSAIGPLVGGTLLEHFWWGAVFLIGVPVMLLLLVLGPILLPEFRNVNAGRPDIPSAALSIVSVLAVIYGVQQMAQDGVQWMTVLAIIGGLVIGALFLHRQHALADPLIDLELFRIPAFSASLATNLLAIFAGFGAFLFIAQYLQLVRGLSPLNAGLWSLPASIALIVGSLLVPVVTRFFRPALVMAGGLVLSAAGYMLLTQVDRSAGLTVVVTGSAIAYLGLAPVVTLATDLIVGAAPPEGAGSAAAISETSIEFGGALGVAILGSIGTAIYRRGVADAVPKGVPPGAARAARDTLGGALKAAGELSAKIGAPLLNSAREAFTQGLHVASAICAVLMLGVAVLTLTLLKEVGSSDSDEARTDDVEAAPPNTR